MNVKKKKLSLNETQNLLTDESDAQSTCVDFDMRGNLLNTISFNPPGHSTALDELGAADESVESLANTAFTVNNVADGNGNTANEDLELDMSAPNISEM